MSEAIPVYLELGARRAFAGAVEWPGWCRSGNGEAAALEALVAHGERYAAAVGKAGGRFTAPGSVDDLDVVERLEGNATTDFGAPGIAPAADERSLDRRELRRLSKLLEASWRFLDRCAAAAHGVPLRKGPRGGGRDLDAIVGHVLDAERSYLWQLGTKAAPGDGLSPADRAAELRRAILDTLVARVRGDELTSGRRARLWTPRYFVRRAAWHVLDHAWEIEDRAREV
ncbi:MAG TPA: hypothetical protein VHK06_06200 [Candidatus Limnocylindria bacterium]|nr:hypothetical protein [Candidatus Limnocylindria bacterium]